VYQDRIKAFIKNVYEPSIKKKVGDHREFLEEYCKMWKKFTLFIFTIKKLFDYLDRYYLKNAGQSNLARTALKIFEAQVFKLYLN